MSFGLKVGRAIGKSAALVGEGAVRGAQGLGQFGNDVLEGTQQGFEQQRALNLINRAKADAVRAEKLAAAKAALAAQPMVAAPMKVKATAKA